MNQSIMDEMEKDLTGRSQTEREQTERQKWTRELLITAVEFLFMVLVLTNFVRTGYVAEDRILSAMVIVLTFIAIITYVKAILSKDSEVKSIDNWIGLSALMAGLTLRFGMNILG